MRISIAIMLGFCLLTVQGCSLFHSPDRGMEKSAETLVNEGVDAYRQEHYRDAIKAFTTLRDWYPFSRYAILAELKIADAHYRLESYEEALPAYEAFEDLHPQNDAMPHVIYRMGMCWYNQIPSMDKDQTSAAKAVAQFQRLIERFPEHRYSVEARKKINRCRERLADHEAYVAAYYLKTRQYKAALKRYEQLFAQYPDTPAGKKALRWIPRCQEKISSTPDGE